MLTIAQIVVMFICYLTVFVGLPAVTFGVRLKRYPLSFRMMSYLVIGNFIVINLVLYLEILHICNRVTLIFFTLFLYFALWLYTHNIDFREWVTDMFLLFEKRSQGIIGHRTLLRDLAKWLWKWVKTEAKWFFDIVIKHIVEWIVFAAVMVLVWYLFGTNFITNFGYNASDIPVHNYWINGLSFNKPFIDGVYPMGYHAAIFYIHKVFRMDTYVLLRLWGLINIYGVVTMLMAFLGCLCKKHPFLPFIGAVVYIAPKVINVSIWQRFHSALPQEYAMIFLLPPLTYLFTFFEERKAEIDSVKEEKQELEKEGIQFTSWDEIEGEDTPQENTDDQKDPTAGEDAFTELGDGYTTAARALKRSGLSREERMKEKLRGKSPRKDELKMRAKLTHHKVTRDEEKMRQALMKKKGLKVEEKNLSDVAAEFVSYETESKDSMEAPITVEKITKMPDKPEAPITVEQITKTPDEPETLITVEQITTAPAEQVEQNEDIEAILDDLLTHVIVETHVDPEVRRKKKIRERAKSLKRSKLLIYLKERIDNITYAEICLLLFALSLSLSVAIHFYPAIVVIVMCFGMVVGYIGRIFRKQYFFSILRAGILAMVLAVLPMGIALMLGTPLQGSMGWAMGVIRGTGSRGQGIVANSKDDDVIDDLEYRASMEAMGFTLNEEGLAVDENGEPLGENGNGGSQRPVVIKQPTKWERLMEKVDRIKVTTQYLPNTIGFYLEEFLLAKDEDHQYMVSGFPQAVYILFGIVLVCGLLSLWKFREYGMQLISFIFGVGFMTLVFIAGSYSLPKLMDPARCELFYYYLLSALFVMGVDGILTVVAGWVPLNAFQWLMSAVAAGAFGYEVYVTDLVREPIYMESMEYNGAIECTTNILAENDDFTFTILSANDELRMIEERGYHYEIIRLLKHMVLYDTQDYTEGSISNIDQALPSDVFIPTKRIYIYIEKVPKDYFTPYKGSGQRISEEGAKRPCPAYEATAVYMGEDRWICMSKIYYWAQAYRKLHPDDMYLYYEDDDFMCYCIEQNDYSLYNLAIDYGYNHCGEEVLEFYYDDKS